MFESLHRLSHFCASLAEERKKEEDLARLATCRFGALTILLPGMAHIRPRLLHSRFMNISFYTCLMGQPFCRCHPYIWSTRATHTGCRQREGTETQKTCCYYGCYVHIAKTHETDIFVVIIAVQEIKNIHKIYISVQRSMHA